MGYVSYQCIDKDGKLGDLAKAECFNPVPWTAIAGLKYFAPVDQHLTYEEVAFYLTFLKELLPFTPFTAEPETRKDPYLRDTKHITFVVPKLTNLKGHDLLQFTAFRYVDQYWPIVKYLYRDGKDLKGEALFDLFYRIHNGVVGNTGYDSPYYTEAARGMANTSYHLMIYSCSYGSSNRSSLIPITMALFHERLKGGDCSVNGHFRAPPPPPVLAAVSTTQL